MGITPKDIREKISERKKKPYLATETLLRKCSSLPFFTKTPLKRGIFVKKGFAPEGGRA